MSESTLHNAHEVHSTMTIPAVPGSLLRLSYALYQAHPYEDMLRVLKNDFMAVVRHLLVFPPEITIIVLKQLDLVSIILLALCDVHFWEIVRGIPEFRAIRKILFRFVFHLGFDIHQSAERLGGYYQRTDPVESHDIFISQSNAPLSELRLLNLLWELSTGQMECNDFAHVPAVAEIAAIMREIHTSFSKPRNDGFVLHFGDHMLVNFAQEAVDDLCVSIITEDGSPQRLLTFAESLPFWHKSLISYWRYRYNKTLCGCLSADQMMSEIVERHLGLPWIAS